MDGRIGRDGEKCVGGCFTHSTDSLSLFGFQERKRVKEKEREREREREDESLAESIRAVLPKKLASQQHRRIRPFYKKR